MLPEFIFDTKVLFAALSGLVSIFVFVNYVRTVLKKETKPHAYTWLIWGLTQGTAVAGLWYGNGGWGAAALTLSTVSVALIFLLSLRYGTKNITRSDTVVLILALLAIVIWWQLDNPLLAILMVTVIDLIGYIPSWRKTAKEPWSEALASWSVSPFGHIFAIAALAEYNFFTLLYPISIVIANYTLVVIGLINRTRIAKPKI